MRLKSGRVIGIGHNEECSIRYEEKYIPIELVPCGHSFCGNCVEKITSQLIVSFHRNGQEGMKVKLFFGTCPLCREKIANADCIADVKEQVKNNYPFEFNKWTNVKRNLAEVSADVASLEEPYHFFRLILSHNDG